MTVSLSKFRESSDILWKPWTHVTFVKNDLNGFVQLFFDNCSTLLIVINLLLNSVWVAPNLTEWPADFRSEVKSIVTSKANDVVWGLVIPGTALAMVFGNVYYSWLACRLSFRENRFRDVSSLPYGLNTPAAFGFIFSILLPTYRSASADCTLGLGNSTTANELGSCLAEAIDTTWKTGVVCNFLAGLFGLGIGLFGKVIERVTPAPALLASLATIGVSFLLLSGVGNAFVQPITGLAPFVIMIIGYLSGVSFDPVPTALVIMMVGTALGWMNGTVSPQGVTDAASYIKWTGVGTGFSALGHWEHVSKYVGVVLPLAIQASVGTLMNVQSAKTVGDVYPVRESMLADGFGCLVGSMLGTPFMTTVYIGHPSYKAIGATMGYSILNCVVFFFVSFTGMFALVNSIIPSSAITPVIAFVGLIICKEAAESVEKREFVIFIIGLLPGICDWAIQGGLGFPQLNTAFFGYYALSRSSIFLAMIISSILYFLVDRSYLGAAAWSIFASICASVGLIHQSSVSVSNYSLPMGGYCVSKSTLGIGAAETCPKDYIQCADGGTDTCGYLYSTRWRFTVAYVMLCGIFLVLYAIQRFTDRVPPSLVRSEKGVEAELSQEPSTSGKFPSCQGKDPTSNNETEIHQV